MGKREGKGKQLWPNGSQYEGDWKQDQFDGFGEYCQENGFVEGGEYHQDQLKGVGYRVDT